MSKFYGYENKNLANAERFIIKSADLYIRTQAFYGSASFNATTSTFTVSGTPFVASELVGGIVVCEGYDLVITANTTSTITVSIPSGIEITTGTKQIRVWGPDRFAGYSEGKSLTIGDNYAEYKTGIPKVTIAKDLIERTVTIKGDWVVSMDSVGSEIFGLLAGLEISGGRFFAGSNPSQRPYFRLSFVSKDRSNKTVRVIGYYGQFETGGDINFDGDDYKRIGFTATLYREPLKPENADILEVRVEA